MLNLAQLKANDAANCGIALAPQKSVKGTDFFKYISNPDKFSGGGIVRTAHPAIVEATAYFHKVSENKYCPFVKYILQENGFSLGVFLDGHKSVSYESMKKVINLLADQLEFSDKNFLNAKTNLTTIVAVFPNAKGNREFCAMMRDTRAELRTQMIVQHNMTIGSMGPYAEFGGQARPGNEYQFEAEIPLIMARYLDRADKIFMDNDVVKEAFVRMRG